MTKNSSRFLAYSNLNFYTNVSSLERKHEFLINIKEIRSAKKSLNHDFLFINFYNDHEPIRVKDPSGAAWINLQLFLSAIDGHTVYDISDEEKSSIAEKQQLDEFKSVKMGSTTFEAFNP